MHDSQLDDSPTRFLRSNQPSRWLRALGLLLAALMVLADSRARAEVIAEGDFTPDYGTDPFNPTDTEMPLFGNDPDGIESPAQMSVPVIIGITGVGRMTIDTPSFTFPLVSLGDPDPSIIGQADSALGEVLVTGFGSEWKVLGKLIVAEEGTAFLNLTGGARVGAEDDPLNPLVATPEIVVGDLPGSEAFVTVDGFGSRLDSAMLTIGNEGNAVVNVSDRGSLLTRGSAQMGYEIDTVTRATFTGLGTFWRITENSTNTALKGTLMIGSELPGGTGHSTLVINDDARVQVDGETTINTHGRVELGGGTLRTIETPNLSDSGFVTNHGVIMGDGWVEGGLLNETEGEIRNTTAGNGLREHLLITGAVANEGLIDSFGGEMEFLSPVVNDQDIVARDALMRFRNGLTNNGQLVMGGNTTVYGDISSTGDIYTLSGSEGAIVGDLTFSSSSVVSVAVGAAMGTLDIIGAADLADSLLQLDYSAGVAAQVGDTYQVISATQGLGGSVFSNSTVVSDGLIWDVLVGADAVTVTAASPAAAPTGSDFNGDNIVDIQDLLIWKENYPITSGANPGQGDADGDGDVDAGDFLIWQMKNGGPPALAVATAVPEPTIGMLLGLGALGLLFAPRGLSRRS